MVPSGLGVGDIELTFESDSAQVRVYAVPNDSKKPKIGSNDDTLPSSNFYSWKASTGTNGGIGKLVIPGSAPNLCVHCEINVAVESTAEESIFEEPLCAAAESTVVKAT